MQQHVLPSVRTRYFNYLHIRTKSGLYLRKRTGKDIWQGLYELPLIESSKPLSSKGLLAELGKGWELEGKHGPVKHVLSHQVIMAMFWKVRAPASYQAPKDWRKVAMDKIKNHALPRLMDRYLQGLTAGK